MTKKESIVRLGRSIRNRRKSLGITQVELADLAGCGPAYIHLIEHGKSGLHLDKLLDVMQVLGLQFALEQGKERIRIDEAI